MKPASFLNSRPALSNPSISQVMLSEINAVTQLLMVCQIFYLMMNCRAFKDGLPYVLSDFEDRDLRNRNNTEEIASIMNEIADGLLDSETGIAHAPMDLKSLLTSVLLSKFQIQPEHGSSPQNPEGEIYQDYPTQETEDELQHP